MSKRSQESSAPGSLTAKAKACCLVSRHGVSVGQDYSSNPENPGSTRHSQVRTWEERSTNFGCCSVQHASGNREYGTENSGGLSETHASGPRGYTRKVVQNMKDRLRHDESISEISMNSDKTHISIWTRFMASSMQAALHMEPSYEKNLEIFKNSEFENIKDFFGITRMMIVGNSNIKNVFPADVDSHSVLCLEKMLGPEDAIKRWNEQMSTLKMCHTFRELRGLDGEPIDFEWNVFPGATALDLLHEIQADLQGKNVTPEKISKIELIFMSMSNNIVPEEKKLKILVLLLRGRSKRQNQRWPLGILGTQRRKQVVSRRQIGSSCFTDGGRVREFRTSGIPGDKSAGPWNTEEENN